MENARAPSRAPRAKHAAEQRRPLDDLSNAQKSRAQSLGRGIGAGMASQSSLANPPSLANPSNQGHPASLGHPSQGHPTVGHPTVGHPSLGPPTVGHASHPGSPSRGAGGPEHVPPSPNMAKRPRSVSMEVVHADKKTRSSAGSTLAAAISEPKDLGFVHRLELVDAPAPAPTELSREDERDPQMCEEYAPQIFTYLHAIQDKFMVDPSYIHQMPARHNWPQNRRTLVNWVLAVHRRFQLLGETLYLAVNMIDRVVSASLRDAATPEDVLPLSDMQVMSATCLFTAAKYEEVMAPAIENFAEVARSTVEELRETERKVLIAINFDLGLPSPLNFLRRVSKADDYEYTERTLAKFLLETSLFEPRLMAFRPSDVAAGAMLAAKMLLMAVWRDQQRVAAAAADGDHTESAFPLAAQILNRVPRPTTWNASFEFYSGGLTTRSLKPIVTCMLRYLRAQEDRPESDFFRKYESSSYLSASALCMEWARGTANRQ